MRRHAGRGLVSSWPAVASVHSAAAAEMDASNTTRRSGNSVTPTSAILTADKGAFAWYGGGTKGLTV